MSFAQIRRENVEVHPAGLELQADSVGLIRRHDGHPAHGGLQAPLVDHGDPVVVLRNDLLIVRIRTIDEPGEYLRGLGSEAEVITLPGHIETFLAFEEPLYVL